MRLHAADNCIGHHNICKPRCDLMPQANLQLTKRHVDFQVEALPTQPQISKPDLLMMLQQGSSSSHLPPLEWETVSNWLGCRHQGECNLHSQIAPFVSELLLSYVHKAGGQLRLLHSSSTHVRMWASWVGVHSGEFSRAGCLRKFASSLCVC